MAFHVRLKTTVKVADADLIDFVWQRFTEIIQDVTKVWPVGNPVNRMTSVRLSRSTKHLESINEYNYIMYVMNLTNPDE